MRKFLAVASLALTTLLAVANPASADPINGQGGGGGISGGQGGTDPFYHWSLTGLDNGSGTLDAETTIIGGTSYTYIQSFSGVIDGFAVTLAGTSNEGGFNTSPAGLFYYDNILYTNNNASSCDGGGTGGLVDLCGILLKFTKNGHTYEGNIFENDPTQQFGYAFLFCAIDGSQSCYGGNLTGDSFSVAIPEPGSLALLGTGLVAAAAAIRRRRNVKKA